MLKKNQIFSLHSYGKINSCNYSYTKTQENWITLSVIMSSCNDESNPLNIRFTFFFFFLPCWYFSYSRLLIHVCFPFCRICCRERDCRTRNKNGQWKTEESTQTAHNLFQFPAGGSAEALSEHSVPRAAGESRARRVSGAHTDTGMFTGSYSFTEIWKFVKTKIVVNSVNNINI